MTVGSKVKQTLADLKGAHGSLGLYLAGSRDEEAKAAFEQAMAEVGKVIGNLEARVRTMESEEQQYKGK